MSDLISRQAVIDWIKTRLYQTALNNDEYITSYAKVCEDIAENRIDTWINEVKSVEPERKTGHWEWDQRVGEYVCSECGCNPIYERTTPDESEIDKYRYCRWCGAKMEVDGNVTEL